MKLTLAGGLLTAVLLTPIAVQADPAASAIVSPELRSEQILVVRPAQVLAIGVGIVSGAIVVEALLSTDFGYLIGGVVGGYVSNVWYNGGQLELHVGTPAKI